MLDLRALEKTCIFCNEPFTAGSVAWLIEERPLREKMQEQEGRAEEAPSARAENAFWDAIDRFYRPDYKGASFYHTMSGNLNLDGRLEAERVRVVLPDDFERPARPGEKSINTYTTSQNIEIPIFQRPGRENPYLRFTKEFTENMKENELSMFQMNITRKFIEEECIRPVCPSCMSYIPREQLDNSQEDAYAARFAYIGQIESGKTTLNWTNLMCDCFSQNGWSSNPRRVFSTTHYLAQNFYEDLCEKGMLPERTPKNKYAPPLLVRLYRGKKTVLLVLMDIAGETIQQFHADNIRDNPNLQAYVYMNLLKQMDGFLIMLDSEKEFSSMLGILNRNTTQTGEVREETDASKEASPDASKKAGSDTAVRNSSKSLYELVKGCLSFDIEEYRKKPAALLLTKCDILFESQEGTPLGRKYGQLFSSFEPVEKKVWQQAGESETVRKHYSADYHECIQLPFQKLLQESFPDLWDLLQNSFARVGVFPESSLGVNADDLPKKGIQKKDLHPFHSVDPIFWLLDVISLSDQEEGYIGESDEL